MLWFVGNNSEFIIINASLIYKLVANVDGYLFFSSANIVVIPS